MRQLREVNVDNNTVSAIKIRRVEKRIERSNPNLNNVRRSIEQQCARQKYSHRVIIRLAGTNQPFWALNSPMRAWLKLNSTTNQNKIFDALLYCATTRWGQDTVHWTSEYVFNRLDFLGLFWRSEAFLTRLPDISYAPIKNNIRANLMIFIGLQIERQVFQVVQTKELYQGKVSIILWPRH